MAPTDTPFRASDLIGSAGVGANGEKLVATLDAHYPPELQAALLRRENERLTPKLRDDDGVFVDGIAKIAGVDHIEDACVRGGERNSDDALVTYVSLDTDGTSLKGCFPYRDLAGGKSDDHVSQRDSVASSPAARDHAAAQAKAREAAATEAEPAAPADPYAALADATAGDLVKVMEEHPDRIDAIKAFESATRGDKARKTVMEFEPEKPTGSDGGDPPAT